MTSQRVERTWIRTGGYGRFRGEWVNINFFNFFFLFKVMLTLMGDESTIPWRVLSIDFLVQDKETGGDLAINRHV